MSARAHAHVRVTRGNPPRPPRTRPAAAPTPSRRAPEPIARVLARLLRPGPSRGPGGDDPVAVLSRRLDDHGCATGRVTRAHQEELSRAFDRLETKLNAILVAVSATFLSTLAGLAVLAVRGGLRLPAA